RSRWVVRAVRDADDGHARLADRGLHRVRELAVDTCLELDARGASLERAVHRTRGDDGHVPFEMHVMWRDEDRDVRLRGVETTSEVLERAPSLRRERALLGRAPLRVRDAAVWRDGREDEAQLREARDDHREDDEPAEGDLRLTDAAQAFQDRRHLQIG